MTDKPAAIAELEARFEAGWKHAQPYVPGRTVVA